MKFLIIFLSIMELITLYFWQTDAAGSGLGYVAIGLAVAEVALLVVNKKRTGSWLSDSTTR